MKTQNFSRFSKGSRHLVTVLHIEESHSGLEERWFNSVDALTHA